MTVTTPRILFSDWKQSAVRPTIIPDSERSIELILLVSFKKQKNQLNEQTPKSSELSILA